MANDPEDQIMAQNQALVGAITKGLKGGKDESEKYNRFLRVLEFYGYAGSNKNLVNFFNMVLDQPEKFKDLDRVTNKWTSPSSITSVLGVLRQVYDIQEVKMVLGDRHEAIVTATKEFIKLAEDTAAKQKKECVATKKAKAPKKEEESPPPSIHDEGDGDTDDASEDSEFDSRHSSVTHVSSKIDSTYRDMLDLKQRLLMYCDAMADIDHHTVKTMVKCIRFDVNRYLARFED